MAWRRKLWITVSPSALRSKPRARSASTSEIGVPSIHSVVSTSRAVRCQSTLGTRKPGSSLVFAAISDNGRGFHAQVEFLLHRLLEHLHGGDRPQPAAFGADRSISRAAKKKLSRSAAKRFSTPGRRTLTATSRPSVVCRLVHLGNRRGRDWRAEFA